MYTLADYVWMVADRARIAAYANALRAQIAPGDRVLEIGAGFGFFSVVACQAGAAHVDAVETNPVVHLGPKFAAANGCADRITFHHQDARQLRLHAPVDLLLADVRGPTPFGRRSIEIIADARDRLLRRGGRIVGLRDRLFVAPSRAPVGVRREVHAARGQLGLVFDPIDRVLSDTPMRFSIEAADLVAPGQPWLELDYRSVIPDTRYAGRAAWQFGSAATVDGLAVWFETDLGGGWGFSTAPGSEVTAYRHVFVPLRRSCPVAQGERFAVELAIRQLRENYLWDWRAWLASADGSQEREVARQNSLAELVVDPAAFTNTAADARPSLGARGRALREVLTRIDGATTIERLADTLQALNHELFPDHESAMQFVTHWADALARLERGTD